jgi:runt-related transcription factor 1
MTAASSPTGSTREASLPNPAAAQAYAAAVAAAAAAAAAAADPLAESRTIYKVKRFLFTLIQFGCDISPETGDRVKELVFSLVVGVD